MKKWMGAKVDKLSGKEQERLYRNSVLRILCFVQLKPKQQCKWRYAAVPQSSEVAQAADALNAAYSHYNHAEGYNYVKAAIYDIRAAELRLGEAVERAKKTKQEAST